MKTQARQEEKAMKTKIKFQRIVLPLLLLGSPLTVHAVECGNPCTVTTISNGQFQLIDSDAGGIDWEMETAGSNSTTLQIGTTGGVEPFKIENGAATNLLFLDAAERIGINTSAPGVTVDAIGNRIRLRNSTAGTAKTIMMRTDGAANDLHSQNAHLFIRSEQIGGDAIQRNIILNPFGNDGNIGIGTTVPDEDFKVDLRGNMRAFFSGSQSGGDGLVPLIALESNNSAAGKSSDTGFALKNVKDNFQWNFRTLEASSAQGFAATKNGSGGAEMIVRNPTNDFRQVSILMGNGAQLTSLGVWTDGSSREYKENIESITLDEAMDALMQLNPVKYHFKRDPDKKELGLGFIAEDVPELVAMKGRKTMSTMKVVATLTKVVQEQQKVIQEQQKAAEARQKSAEEQQKLTMALSDKLAELEKLVKSNAMVAMQ